MASNHDCHASLSYRGPCRGKEWVSGISLYSSNTLWQISHQFTVKGVGYECRYVRTCLIARRRVTPRRAYALLLYTNAPDSRNDHTNDVVHWYNNTTDIYHYQTQRRRPYLLSWGVKQKWLTSKQNPISANWGSIIILYNILFLNLFICTFVRLS